MSGGSFDYLYKKDGLDLVDDHQALIAMVNQLEEWAPNSQAFYDARSLLSEIQEAAQRLAKIPDASLQRVFHDVEWAVSHDYSKEQAMERIEKYAQTLAHEQSQQPCMHVQRFIDQLGRVRCAQCNKWLGADNQWWF